MPQSENSSAARVELIEVGPRDGLQNESVLLTTAQKIDLIGRAISAGARRIEVTSFVHPDRVPQMADAEAVVAALPEVSGIVYIGLVLNKRGALRALETKVHELGAVCVATDSFAQRNQGQTSQESLDVACGVVRLARAEGRNGQITIGASFGCPFEGEVDPRRVVDMAKRAAEVEPREIALADTIGVAVPSQVRDLVGAVRDAIGSIPVRCHFHNTRNTAVANAWTAFEAGARSFDASIGGIGGCPFAPAATGNVATEDLTYLFERAGVATGVSLAGAIANSVWLGSVMGRELSGMVARAGAFPGTN